MERNDNKSKHRIESTNTTKNMFSMVEQVNAGYGKYFDSKPKPSMPRSECYKNYIACGTTSQDQPKGCVPISDKENNSENGSHPASSSHKNIIQEFFPQGDETKQRNDGSGCCKYLSAKNGK